MISLVLNLPYTLIGLLVAPLLGIREAKWNAKPPAIIFRVKRETPFNVSYMKGWRGMTMGHVVILNPREEDRDLAHELIHVEQLMRAPLIQPLLYYLEHLQNGYRDNKYEKEAYARAGNAYKGLYKKGRSGERPFVSSE